MEHHFLLLKNNRSHEKVGAVSILQMLEFCGRLSLCFRDVGASCGITIIRQSLFFDSAAHFYACARCFNQRIFMLFVFPTRHKKEPARAPSRSAFCGVVSPERRLPPNIDCHLGPDSIPRRCGDIAPTDCFSDGLPSSSSW